MARKGEKREVGDCQWSFPKITSQANRRGREKLDRAEKGGNDSVEHYQEKVTEEQP